MASQTKDERCDKGNWLNWISWYVLFNHPMWDVLFFLEDSFLCSWICCKSFIINRFHDSNGKKTIDFHITKNTHISYITSPTCSMRWYIALLVISEPWFNSKPPTVDGWCTQGTGMTTIFGPCLARRLVGSFWKKTIPTPQSLTEPPWKWMVGRWSLPFGKLTSRGRTVKLRGVCHFER